MYVKSGELYFSVSPKSNEIEKYKKFKIGYSYSDDDLDYNKSILTQNISVSVNKSSYKMSEISPSRYTTTDSEKISQWTLIGYKDNWRVIETGTFTRPRLTPDN
jgi:hypothetical protein